MSIQVAHPIAKTRDFGLSIGSECGCGEEEGCSVCPSGRREAWRENERRHSRELAHVVNSFKRRVYKRTRGGESLTGQGKVVPDDRVRRRGRECRSFG